MAAEAKVVAPGLRRSLRGREFFALAFGSMIGVGWVLVIDDWLKRGGAVGAMLGFLIGGLVLAPVAYVYGKLTEKLPDAGSEVAYTAEVFPSGASFATGWAMTLAYLIVCPFEAVAVGRVASFLLPQMNSVELSKVGGTPFSRPHLWGEPPLPELLGWINLGGIHVSAAFQNTPPFGLFPISPIFAVLGAVKETVENWQPPFSDLR